jgi:hypothetical protein
MDHGPSELESLYAFYLEHRLCGELDGGFGDNDTGEARTWMDCPTCEVRIVRNY